MLPQMTTKTHTHTHTEITKRQHRLGGIKNDFFMEMRGKASQIYTPLMIQLISPQSVRHAEWHPVCVTAVREMSCHLTFIYHLDFSRIQTGLQAHTHMDIHNLSHPSPEQDQLPVCKFNLQTGCISGTGRDTRRTGEAQIVLSSRNTSQAINHPF